MLEAQPTGLGALALQRFDVGRELDPVEPLVHGICACCEIVISGTVGNVTRSLSMTGQAKRAPSIRNHQLVIFGIETMAGYAGDTPFGHEHG
jgi:hypothetical protein